MYEIRLQRPLGLTLRTLRLMSRIQVYLFKSNAKLLGVLLGLIFDRMTDCSGKNSVEGTRVEMGKPGETIAVVLARNSGLE